MGPSSSSSSIIPLPDSNIAADNLSLVSTDNGPRTEQHVQDKYQLRALDLRSGITMDLTPKMQRFNNYDTVIASYGQVLSDTGFGYLEGKFTFDFTDSDPKVTIRSLNRWRLAALAFQQYPDVWEKYRERHDMSTALATIKRSDADPPIVWRFCTRYPLKDSFVRSSSDLWTESSWTAGGLYFIMTTIYGAIHAIAWNDYFPSPVERLLWRITCLCIAASGCFFASWNYFDNRYSGTWPWSGILFYSLLFIYSLCRLYMVVEAFIGLRSLPVAAYHSPQIAQYIPHI
ncbi:MAG: hypothetical protein M1833_000937 [Piccolia ochrophora]|nr:MAG: hypothetical protein M1833_000937 [Piccolia ochrophora]